MIEKISGLPDNVLGFAAKGVVTANDYEKILIPEVERLFRRQNKVRLLYDLGEEFTGFEAAAMWDDAKLGLKHFASWDRLAVVTDIEWIRGAIKVFRHAMPGEVRLFGNRELAEAKRWISE